MKEYKNKPTALYRHFNKEGVLLYVGISVSAMTRLFDHTSGSHWADEITSVTIERFPNRKAALKAESEAIKNEYPQYNNGMMGDHLTEHAMEYLLEYRDDPPPGYEIREDGGLLLPWMKKTKVYQDQQLANRKASQS